MAGKVVVTGATGGLGSATVTRLTELGWTVIAVNHGSDVSDGAAFTVGGIDLTNEAQVAQAAARIAEKYQTVDALVNIAGGFAFETVASGGVATWDRLFSMNLHTALVASRAFIPQLQAKGGAIVNIGAVAGEKGDVGMGPYAASKAAVARLTQALAEELKDQFVRVNAVLPSTIDTPANRTHMPNADFTRWVAPTDLANVIAFLISAEAKAVTGALIPVTGRV